MNYRKDIQEASTDAIEWSVSVGDSAYVENITLLFGTAPTTTEDITITLKSDDGDCLRRKASGAGVSCIEFKDIGAVLKEDYILVEFPNTDAVSIKGIATVEI
jgi:hypothetical protein